MRVAIVGAAGFGAREHALYEAIRQQSPEVSLFCYPGNAKTGENIPLKDIHSIVRDCKERKIDLIIAGPEKDLADGLVDLAKREDLLVFGPTREGVQLEADKHFAKVMLRDCAIPTASWRFFPQRDLDLAAEFVKHKGPPVVIKAVGLAAGKGVGVFQHSIDQAEIFLSALYLEASFQTLQKRASLWKSFFKEKRLLFSILSIQMPTLRFPWKGRRITNVFLIRTGGPIQEVWGHLVKPPFSPKR